MFDELADAGDRGVDAVAELLFGGLARSVSCSMVALVWAMAARVSAANAAIAALV